MQDLVQDLVRLARNTCKICIFLAIRFLLGYGLTHGSSISMLLNPEYLISMHSYGGYYHIAKNFGEFDESSVIRQIKTIQISTYNQ